MLLSQKFLSNTSFQKNLSTYDTKMNSPETVGFFLKEKGLSLSADDLALLAAVLVLLGDVFALLSLLKEREEKAKEKEKEKKK